jgi:hypothetical protein
MPKFFARSKTVHSFGLTNDSDAKIAGDVKTARRSRQTNENNTQTKPAVKSRGSDAHQ